MAVWNIRYYIDPATEMPHIYDHDVTENEVEEVLARPGEDRQGKEGSRVAIGQAEGRTLFTRHLRARSETRERLRHNSV